MLLAAWVQNHDFSWHQEGGQRNVLGDDEITGLGVLGDVLIGHIGPPIDADGSDERVSRGSLQPLVGDEDRCYLEPLGRPEDQLLHVPRCSICVHPDFQASTPRLMRATGTSTSPGSRS